MYDIFIKKILIDKVRHLENIDIPICNDKRKHLILTGKNGSGKTSLLQALSRHLNYLTTYSNFSVLEQNIKSCEEIYNDCKQENKSENSIAEAEKQLNLSKRHLENAKQGLDLELNVAQDGMTSHFNNGDFILAYYEATRKFNAIIPNHVEKIRLKDNYTINETPRSEFVKYILDLKVTEALSKTSGKNDKAKKIQDWFDNFEKLLKRIFDDESVYMIFDEDNFSFTLHQDGREPFTFNELSDGYAAILDIVVDLMVRMEKHLKGGLSFDVPGIVLIDEIETHLHLELQRTVLDFLTSVFPNIQFIISTHSPFILNSIDNAVIYDLQNHTLVKDGLTDLPYDGIVKGYFEVDELSKELREKYERYKKLIVRKQLSNDDMEEIAKLELYLDEIPDYLALEITTEYRRLKAEFDAREDL